ncbi:MAG: thiamine pyrophosphate-dependent enzyme [Candidatus Zipacnadales bacterium]
MAETQVPDALEGMERVAGRPQCLADIPFTYCPGCTHGTIHRLVAESIDDLGLGDRAVAVAPVGCAVWLYEFFAVDAIQAPHGRAPAVATGVKRVRPENLVFTYQGDGDLAGIGLAEVTHAAARGERITCFFVNNAVFGMTQGQMAPTTLLGQVTSTSPRGRDPHREGYPIRICEMLATVEGAAHIERVTVIDPPSIRRAKQAIHKALRAQSEDRGFALVEFLSICPTWWGKKPLEAAKWLRENMMVHYPLGVFKTFE